MKPLFLIITFVIIQVNAFSQMRTIQVSAGPEFTSSFASKEGFLGVGGVLQAEWWVSPAFGIGGHTGYHYLSSKITNYSAIPLLGVIRYQLPFNGWYGQDMIGYTFTQQVHNVATNESISGGFTYYFSFGYVIKHKYDIAFKIGGTLLNKSDVTSNANNNNLGLRFLYRF